LFSKYVAFLQLLCWAFVFLLVPGARTQLRRPGPYLALVVQLLFLLPVLIWNEQHDWITVKHVSESTQAGSSWKPTLRYLNDFFFSELALLNPFFFIAAWVAGVGVWLRKQKSKLELYLFCMGAPLFLFLLLYSLKARILPNWIAPSIVPLFAMTVLYWRDRWKPEARLIRYWSTTGVLFGLITVVLLHNTELIQRITGKPIPVNYDPLRRVRAWKATAEAVDAARQQLLEEGKPVFVIGHHYGLTSQLSFYLPASREALRSGSRLAYFMSSDRPRNQFYFWPGYTNRHGENAVFVVDFSPKNPKPVTPPPVLMEEFESVTDLGLHPVDYKGRTLRWIQLFECRGLR